jgi:hypothetical protein
MWQRCKERWQEMKELKIDKEFQNLIPPLTNEEYKQLEENLKDEGCRDSLITWENTIIDGHNRYEICTKNIIPFSVKEMNFEDRQEAIEWIIKNQFGRRNLPAYERAKLALRLEPIIREKAKERQGSRNDLNIVQKSAPSIKNKSRDELAKIAGVSHDTIEKVKFIEREATEEQKQALSKGEKKVNTVYKELRPVKSREEHKSKPIESKNSEMKICNICGKEKPFSEFYSTQKNCKQCEATRKRVGLTVEKAKELNEKFSDEELNKMYEEMKSPHPIGQDTGENIYKPIISEIEDILNEFNGKINKFLFMETYLNEAKSIKPLLQDNIKNLETIINFIKE